jgi:hypothetical protein
MIRTNVFYLAPPAPPLERARPLSRQLRLRLGLLAFWCRVRMTAAEVAGVLRRFGRPDRDADAFLEQSADLFVGARPARLVPARVIDLEAARARLRP